VAGNTSEVIVRILTQEKQAVAGLQNAQRAVEGFEKQAKKTEAVTASFNDRLVKVGKAIPTAYIAGMAAAGGAVIKFASDQVEQLNKVRVVFGQNSKAIESWAKDAAKNMGLSQRAALEAAGTFGNLFKAMRIGDKPAVDMSKNLVQLGADLASFNNVDPSDVLNALRSGLVGEIEPLRRFGVNLSQARIEQEAVRLGLAAHGETLNASAKAQAAYAIIMADTTTAQGDFARTSDSAANQMRTLKAHLEDTAASMGQALLPAFSKALGVISTAADLFGKLPDPIKAAAGGLVVLGASAAITIKVAGSMITSWRAVSEAFDKTTVAGKNLGNLLRSGGLIAGGIAVTALGLEAISRALAGAPTSVDKMTSALVDLNKENKVGGVLAEQFGNDFEQLAEKVQTIAATPAWARSFAKLTGGTRDAIQDVDSLDKALAELVSTGHGDQAAKLLEEIGKRLDAATKAKDWGATVPPKDMFKELRQELNDYTGAQDAATKAGKLGGLALDEEGDAAAGAAQQFASLAERHLAYQDALVAQAEADRSVTRAQQAHTDAQKELDALIVKGARDTESSPTRRRTLLS
jgi:hypothetical protein